MDNKQKSKENNQEKNVRGEKNRQQDPDARSERLIIDEQGKPHSIRNHETGDSANADQNQSGSPGE